MTSVENRNIHYIINIKNRTTMKKIVMTMAALLTMTLATAQNNDKCQGNDKCNKEKCERKQHKHPTPEEMTDRMAKDLNLSDAQKAKVLALNKEYEDMFKGPRMGGPRPPRKPKADAETGATEQQKPERPQLTDEQKAKMKAQKAKREEYDKKLKGILNDDQYAQYKEKHQFDGRGPRHGHHGGHHGHGPRPFMGE